VCDKGPRVSIREAARRMGVPEQMLRIGLQNDKFSFGTAVRGRGRWSYYINRQRFETYMSARDMRQEAANE